MAPEIELSEERLEAVREWIHERDGDFVVGGDNGLVEIYNVLNEPLAVNYKLPNTKSFTKGQLLCSENQAKELGETGIVRFPEVKVESQ